MTTTSINIRKKIKIYYSQQALFIMHCIYRPFGNDELYIENELAKMEGELIFAMTTLLCANRTGN